MDDFNAKAQALDAIRSMAKQALADRVKKKAALLVAVKKPDDSMDDDGDNTDAGPDDMSDDDLQALLEEYGKGC